MTSDGRWNYAWDAENRLLRVQRRSDTPQGSWRRVEWQYDALGRRIRQTTSTWLMQSNLWVVTEDLKFLSDPLLFGRHVVDLNASNNVPLCSYVWGLDLSETMDRAGGVGGLLWMTLHTGSGAGVGTHFCAYDGNGNVVALASASDGSPTAGYEYGPFGEPIRVTGPAAALNPFRFSTKRTSNTEDFVLYERRLYISSLARWGSRDPAEEEVGGLNLYGFVDGNPLGTLDKLGLRVVVFSAGYAFRDPLYASIGDRVYSGLLPSTQAFYYGWGSPWSTSICNSGPLFMPGFPKESTSFVKAWMMSLCPGRYRVTCHAQLTAYVWGAMNRRVFNTYGHMLGLPVRQHETVTAPIGPDAYFSMFSKTVSKDISVHGKYVLYYLYMPIGLQVRPHFKGGFAEYGIASCEISKHDK